MDRRPGPFGPTPPPATDWRRLLVADDGTPSDSWRVGENQPGEAGWAVEYVVTPATGSRLVAALTVHGRGQGPSSFVAADSFDASIGGKLWIPWARFELSFIDAAAPGAPANSSVGLFAIQVPCSGTTPSPIVYGREDPATVTTAATETATVPSGATAYRIGLNPGATWSGPLVVDERSSVAGGGSKVNVGQGVYSQASASAQLDRGGWREVPNGPAADLLLTNTDAGGVSVGVTVHWRFDLSRSR